MQLCSNTDASEDADEFSLVLKAKHRKKILDQWKWLQWVKCEWSECGQGSLGVSAQTLVKTPEENWKKMDEWVL